LFLEGKGGEKGRGGILLEQFHFNLIERAASYSVHSLKMHRIVKFNFKKDFAVPPDEAHSAERRENAAPVRRRRKG
jgi:hypothetical protein